MKPKPMTKTALLLVTLLVLPSAFAQTAPPPPATPGRLPGVMTLGGTGTSETSLTKFSLDFPGGTPKQLVAAIEKAMAKPLNAIIPPEHADVMIPPLKMSNVDVRQLFQALELTSQKTEAYSPSGFPGTSQLARTGYGFRTQGQISDESIWYFYVDKIKSPPPTQTRPQPKVCRYFSLAPYLERGQTVDDITTAIQTGWKMLGEDNTPKISFHKETKLLIAVGEPEKLETIDAVLKALKTPSSSWSIDPTTGLPVPPSAAIPQGTLKTPSTGASAAQGTNPAPSKP